MKKSETAMLSDDELRAMLIAEARRMAEQAGENPDSMTVNEDMLAQVMLACRVVERAAYERAAQECEAQISGSDHHYLATHGHWDHMAQAATNCAAAIRALGRQHD